MEKTFGAIERAKRDKDSQKAMAPPQLKERGMDVYPEVPLTLIDTKKKQVLLPTRSFEQYQQLKASLLNRYPDLRHKVIMIVSSIDNEGCATTAVNLAKALAEDDEVRVLLVDSNLRNHSPHQVFGLDNKYGFSNVVCCEIDTDQAIKETDKDNLFIITSGRTSRPPASTFRCQGPRLVFDQLKDQL